MQPPLPLLLLLGEGFYSRHCSKLSQLLTSSSSNSRSKGSLTFFVSSWFLISEGQKPCQQVLEVPMKLLVLDQKWSRNSAGGGVCVLGSGGDMWQSMVSSPPGASTPSISDASAQSKLPRANGALQLGAAVEEWPAGWGR